MKNTEIIEWLFLLPGSAMVVYVLCKSFYQERIQAMESVNSKLKSHRDYLRSETEFLQERLHEMGLEMTRMLQEMDTLRAKAGYVRIVYRKPKNYHFIRKGKGSIFHKRFDEVSDDKVINLTQIHGVGLWVEEKQLFGVINKGSIHRLISFDMETIEEDLEILSDTRMAWVTRVSELAKKQLNQTLN